MVATQFIKQGYPGSKVLEMCGIASSTYYYKAKTKGKRGRTKSQYTFTQKSYCVDNQAVVEQITELLSQEFVDYGYLKTTHFLRQEFDYVINPKKVYRLMKEGGLLQPKVKRRRRSRNWVKDLVPSPSACFEYLEVDIKYVYVAGLRKNVLVLSIIDVRSRWILGHHIAMRIGQKDVIKLFKEVFSQYQMPKKFFIRNDNGAQFEAGLVQKFFADTQGANQEFCKPATPEQNAHIESYHSIMESVICQKYEFEDLKDIILTMKRFVLFYNYKRIHSGVGYTSPDRFIKSQQIDLNKINFNRLLTAA